MTRPRAPRLRSAPTAPVRPAKALALSVDVVAELTARCEVHRRELLVATRLVEQGRARALRDQRQLQQLRTRLELANERITQLEEEAATAYALTQERDSRGAAHLEQELTQLEERRTAEKGEATAEIANLRDALAAALERERSFRRTEADLRRRLGASSGVNAQNAWEPEDAHATLEPVDSGEVATNGLPIVP